LRHSARAASFLLSELLRVEAIVLTEVGGLAQSLGQTIREALESGRFPSEPERFAAGATEDAEQTAGEHSQSAEPVVTPIAPHAPLRSLDIPTSPPHVSPSPPSANPVRLTQEAPAEPQTGPAGGHVSEEPVLVSESADAGAAEGAGASVHIREPWSGYRSMRAPEIVDRLATLPDEVLSLVLLYETKPGKARRTVLQEAERELSRRAA
jgi:hypothetical protein